MHGISWARSTRCVLLRMRRVFVIKVIRIRTTNTRLIRPRRTKASSALIANRLHEMERTVGAVDLVQMFFRDGSADRGGRERTRASSDLSVHFDKAKSQEDDYCIAAVSAVDAKTSSQRSRSFEDHTMSWCFRLRH